MQVAPNQISPGEPFDVFYFIRNHTDASTYYVRAKIYDVRTGELLSTIALEQSATNLRLFIKTIQAPPDPVGYGRNIVAVAGVYTDSGFTTLSDIYEEQEQYYLIKAVMPVLGGGGIDYRVLREMLEEVVDARLAKLPPPKDLPEMPFTSLFGSIGVLHRELGRVPKEVFDATELRAQLERVQESIRAIPEPEKVDLAPVLEAINELPGQIEQAVADAKEDIRQVGKEVAKEIRTSLMAFEGEIVGRADKGLQDLFGRQSLNIPFSALTPKKEPETADVSHIM